MIEHPFVGGDELKQFVGWGYFAVPATCFTGVILFPTLGDIIDAQNIEPDSPIVVEKPT